MAKTGRKWIIRDWNDQQCLRAEDIPVNSTQSILDALTSSNATIIYLNVKDFKLDIENFGADFGNYATVFPSIDFSATENGSIYSTFELPINFNINTDIILDFIYSVNGIDTSNNIKLNIDVWTLTNENPTISEYTGSDTITITSNMEGKRYKQIMTNVKIPASIVTSSDLSISMKITRDVSVLNNHLGTLQLLAINCRQ